MTLALRRPLIHHIAIATYALVPALQLAAFYLFANAVSTEIFLSFVGLFGIAGTLMLILFPVVAAGLYFVHRLCWYAFLAHATLVVAENSYRLARYGGPYFTATLLVSVLMVAIVGFIVQRDFRAPYFQGLVRGWRTNRRYPVQVAARIGDREVVLQDVSISGCFLTAPADLFPLGETHMLSLPGQGVPCNLHGEVVRHSSNGIGIRFQAIEAEQRRNLKAFINHHAGLSAETVPPVHGTS